MVKIKFNLKYKNKQIILKKKINQKKKKNRKGKEKKKNFLVQNLSMYVRLDVLKWLNLLFAVRLSYRSIFIYIHSCFIHSYHYETILII